MGFVYGRDVFITGGSSGIGAACARMFAQNGYRVFAGARSRGRAREHFEGGGEIIPVVVDVSSEASVKAAVASIMKMSEGIGIVIHCAGIGIAGAAEDTPDEAAHRQMEVNYFGVLRVNRHMLPHMRAAGKGLIIITSSVAGIFSIPYQSHYSSSKFALEAYARALRLEIEPFNIKVALIEPGDTRTGFTSSRVFSLPEDSPYEAECRRSVAKMERDEQNGKPPETVAKLAMAIARKKNPPVYRVVGLDYKLLVFLRRLLPERLILFLLKKMYLKGKRLFPTEKQPVESDANWI